LQKKIAVVIVLHGYIIGLMENNLYSLCKQFKTDKLEIGHVEYYESYFKPLRYEKLNILEIGVFRGNSIKVWSEYFANSTIIGIDIEKIDVSIFNSNKKNIEIHQGSQNDKEFLDKIISKYTKFDIIIDDGSHYPKDVIRSFKILFPALDLNGLYFIEDMQTSYNHFFHGNAFDLKYSNTHMNFFKHLTDSLNYQEIANPFYKKNVFDSKIKSISFYHNLVVVKKGLNNQESNIVFNNSYEKKLYLERVKQKGKTRFRYIFKYLIILRFYTFLLYFLNLLKKIILFRY
jgi:23S rRNA U2552 (ribose-2'-O)-methylase RlmE/FtsJ